MKKTISIILAVAVLALLAASLGEVRSLRQQISQVKSNQEYNERDMSNRLQRLESQIYDLQNDQETMFHSLSWEYGKLDLENNTVEVQLMAIPKTYSVENSQVEIQAGEKRIPLTLASDRFIGSFQMGLFESLDIQEAVLVSQGVRYTEDPRIYINPRDNLLIRTHANFGGQENGRNQKEGYVWHPKYVVNCQVEATEHTGNLQSAQMICLVDGKEIVRKPIDRSVTGQKAYQRAAEKIDEHRAYSIPGPETGGVENFICVFDEQIPLPAGSAAEVYVELQDEYGFVYRIFVNACALNAEGQRDMEWEQDLRDEHNSHEAIILDQTGKVLYNPYL